VRRGKPYREVLAYVREKGIDLVCVGALGRDFGLETLFGSNADRMLRQARCPVLVARPLMPSTSTSLDSRLEVAR
jgi:nucleotide-binding universal stress UspA family protein